MESRDTWTFSRAEHASISVIGSTHDYSFTHRQENVTPIENKQDFRPNSCEVGKIAHYHQQHCNDMMCEHLYMILPSLFDVQNYDLGGVEREADEIVKLDRTSDRSVGV